MSHFADRLIRACRDKHTSLCVGIDPVYERLPQQIIEHKAMNDPNDAQSAVDAIFEFCTQLLRTVAPHVPAVKFNSAFFERYYWEGVESYFSLVEEASELGLEVIGDVKRGDIGSTAEAYARGQLANPVFSDMDGIVGPDAVTVNGYFGTDGLKPFVEVASAEGKGVFVLCRTSNPSAACLQDFTDADGKKLWEVVAEQVAEVALDDRLIGEEGFSCIGLVAGGTDPQTLARLRERYPKMLLLVPGYGAQGATAEQIKVAFRSDGLGALVNASRSIIYAHENETFRERFGDNWTGCIEQAVLDAKKDLNNALTPDNQ